MILKRDHGEVYYEVYGEGEPLLLIHGVIVDAAFYEKTAQILSRHYKVICYDRRGYSRSKSENLTEYHMEEQAGDILALLNELGIERVKIAGASAGAVIGQYFLCNYPDRVEHLIMHEPAMLGHMLEEDEEFAKWAQDIQYGSFKVFWAYRSAGSQESEKSGRSMFARDEQYRICVYNRDSGNIKISAGNRENEASVG